MTEVHDHPNSVCMCWGSGIYTHSHPAGTSKHGHICTCDEGQRVRAGIEEGLKNPKSSRHWSDVKKELGLS